MYTCTLAVNTVLPRIVTPEIINFCKKIFYDVLQSRDTAEVFDELLKSVELLNCYNRGHQVGKHCIGIYIKGPVNSYQCNKSSRIKYLSQLE